MKEEMLLQPKEQLIERAEQALIKVLDRYEITGYTDEQLHEMTTWLAGVSLGNRPYPLPALTEQTARQFATIAASLEAAIGAVTEENSPPEFGGSEPWVRLLMRDEPELYERTVEGMRKMLALTKEARDEHPKSGPKQARPTTWKGIGTLFLADHLADLGVNMNDQWLISSIIADMLIEFGAEKSPRPKVVRAIYDRLHRKYIEATR